MTTPHNLTERFELAQQVTRDASLIAQSFFKSRDDLLIRSKRPQDFVSEADNAVEELIRRHIAQNYPEDAFLGEELGGRATDAFWCIDPIDGTANFLRGSPLWGISLAYLVKSEVQLGVISLPELDLTLSAHKGQGAQHNSKPLAKPQTTTIQIASVGENVHWSAQSIAKLELLLRESGWGLAEYRCATVGLVFAALGYTDGYLEKYTSLWDIAAGALICEETGLHVEMGGEMTTAGMWIKAGSLELLTSLNDLWTEL